MTLKERLRKYLRDNHGWVAKGDLQRLVAEKTSYTPENAGRRLRELEVEGKLEVQYRKGHAWYRYVPSVYEVHHREMQEQTLFG